MEGNVEIDGQRRSVAVFDSGCNGVFGDNAEFGRADTLVFFNRSNGGLTNYKELRIPFLVEFKLGRFWEPQVAKNGKRVVFKLDATPAGQLEFRGAELRFLEVVGVKGHIVPQVVGGKVALPAGRYALSNAEFRIGAVTATAWDLYLASVKSSEDIEVQPNAVGFCEVGAPFRVELVAGAVGKARVFTVSLFDRSGAIVRGLSHDKGDPPSAPRLTVADPSGKVVKDAAFEYG
jgi:hypothetical protein